MIFKKTAENLFFKSKNLNDDRLGSLVQSVSAQEYLKISSMKENFVIAGYADDEGIRNNSGRPGAHLAPSKIREYLYKMTPVQGKPSFDIFDLGDLDPSILALSERHQKVIELATAAYKNKSRWIGLGGGHDYGYPDVASFLKSAESRPLVVNFDAHLDVRPTSNGISSGTPFFRILEEFSDLDFIELGIQSQCNSIAHLEYCRKHEVQILNYDELRNSDEDLKNYFCSKFSRLLTEKRPSFLSIDIDSFSNAYAPGCSQSFATGFEPNEFFKLFSFLNRKLDVRGIGIYECSPPLDQDNHTSKLAALIVHKYLFGI